MNYAKIIYYLLSEVVGARKHFLMLRFFFNIL